MNPLGGFRENGGLPLFFSPKGALTHHRVGTNSISFAPPRAAGLIHSVVPPFPTKSTTLWEPFCGGGTCRWQAVRSARQMRLLRKPPDNATALAGAVVIVCADGKTQPQTCLCGGLRFVTHLPPACSKLSQEQSFGYVQAALPQIGHRLRRHPILFAKKKQKARAQNDGVTVRYPIFERGRKECEFNAHPCSVASV